MARNKHRSVGARDKKSGGTPSSSRLKELGRCRSVRDVAEGHSEGKGSSTSLEASPVEDFSTPKIPA